MGSQPSDVLEGVSRIIALIHRESRHAFDMVGHAPEMIGAGALFADNFAPTAGRAEKFIT